MSTPASSLPERWVHSLWAEMRANYGARWDRQFPVPPCMPGTDPAKHAHEHIAGIQAVWAKRLGHLQSNPKALRFALDHLPENPPTLPEFASLCNRRPDKQAPALEAPPVNKAVAEAALAKAATITGPHGDLLFRQREHMRMEIAGERLSMRQREFWRIALRSEVLRKYGIDTAEPFSISDLAEAIQRQPIAA